MVSTSRRQTTAYAAMISTLVPTVMPLYASAQLTQIERPSDVSISLESRIIQITRASDCETLTLPSSQSNLVFGYSVQHQADIDGDGYSELIIASPPASTESSGGHVMLVSPESGTAIWQADGPAGMRSGYLAIVVDDQDLDGVSDIIVACYNAFLTPYTWLLSGASGQTLTIVQQNLFNVIDQLEQGLQIYSPSDLDASKTVDIQDLLEFITIYDTGSTNADIIKDGVVDSLDFAQIVDDFLAGIQLIADEIEPAETTDDLAIVVLHPEETDPWDHHVKLAELHAISADVIPGISTITTPQAALILLIEALAAQGYTIAQIVLILAGMGFSAVLIAEALGQSVEWVEQILAQSTHWLYCRQLYASYKAACALARSCGNGPGIPSSCDEYRANFLANAVCAIMRSKHMTQCIPSSLRPVWDPGGGHGTSINERWQAAAKCAMRFAEAGCGHLPPLTPTVIPGLPPITIPPLPGSNVCTTGDIRYSGAHTTSCELCESSGLERFTDAPVDPVDWSWINSQIGIE